MLEKLEELMKAEVGLEEKQAVLQDAKKELVLLRKKADEYVLNSNLLICLHFLWLDDIAFHLYLHFISGVLLLTRSGNVAINVLELL